MEHQGRSTSTARHAKHQAQAHEAPEGLPPDCCQGGDFKKLYVADADTYPSCSSAATSAAAAAN